MRDEYKLIKATRLSSGTIRHQVTEPGPGENTRSYFDVRMGLTWPSADNPPFACMVGEAWFDRQLYASDRGTMCLLWESEYHGMSIDRFFDKVTDAFTSYCATQIYADLSAEDYRSAFLDYTDSRHLSTVSLHQAPYSDDFYLGLSQIKDLDSAGDLEIPKTSQLFDEMRRIQRADLSDRPEVNFPRLNALRFTLGGLLKSPPIPQINPRISMQYGYDDQGWMA